MSALRLAIVLWCEVSSLAVILTGDIPVWLSVLVLTVIPVVGLAKEDSAWSGDVPAAVEFGRVGAAPVNTLRQQTHRCQEISVCF